MASRYIQMVLNRVGNPVYVGVIYSYTLKATNQAYVGQAANEDARKQDWLRTSCKYGGVKIHSARSQYGISLQIWDYSQLETVVATDLKELQHKLDERETFWIDALDSFKNGFNGNRGGKGLKGVEMSDGQREKIRAAQNEQITIHFADGSSEVMPSHKAAAGRLQVSESTISRYLKSGKSHKNGFSLSK